MSRSNARSRRLRHRPSRTVPASIVAVVLLAVGVLTALLAIARLVNGSWATPATRAATGVADLTWAAPAVAVASGATVVVGLVLLVAGLKPGPFRSARLAPAQPQARAGTDTDFVISTRAVARLAVAHADLVDGVDRVSASASSRRVRVRATTTSEQTEEIRERIRQGVSRALTDAGLQPTPRITTTVRTKGI